MAEETATAGQPIVIEVGSVRLEATLNGSVAAAALAAALPLAGSVSRWGDEIYFATPLTMTEAPDATEVVPVGAVAYWPPGKALCIFFGPTPVSRGSEPRAYSPVNVVGQVVGDAGVLRQVRSNTPVRVTLGSGAR